MSIREHYFVAAGVTVIRLTPDLSSICPVVTFTCDAVELPDSTFRWYFSGIQYQHFVILFSGPVFKPSDYFTERFEDVYDGFVDVKLISAELRKDTITTLVSNLTVDISALQTRHSSVSCGTVARQANVPIEYNATLGKS